MSSKFRLGAFAPLAFVACPQIAAAQEDVLRDEIIVTASPIVRSVDETIVGTTILKGEDLERNLGASIGETLSRQPGISSTFFGPGASRPVIRGLGGDRISVLDSGIGSIDASSTSPDHAVAAEPATAERIEIVRGVATLLYGSSAAGGVVNVFSGRIPTAVPEGGADGALRIGKTTVDDGVEAAGGFDVDLGRLGAGHLVFHGEGAYREADDYEIPGFAESQRLRDSEPPPAPGDPAEEEVFGVVENSSLTTRGGSAGLSYVFEDGFFGVSATAMNSDYAVPGAHGDGDEEGGVSIALEQRRIDVNGEVETDLGLFSKAKLRVGYADYTHSEIEPSGEVGTVFANEGVEGRFELVDKTISLGESALDGAVGVQWRLRAFSAIGEEAFVPPTDTRQVGVFAMKALSRGALRVEVGGRYETTRHEAPDLGAARSFDAFSASAGVSFAPTESLFFGVTALRTERAPSTEELFSDGPHLATNAFEIGDSGLGIETARGVEATARFGGERVSFAVNGFYTSYRDFIFENAAGADADVDGELIPIFLFQATDATFKGFEAELNAELFQLGEFHFHGHAAADFVRATADASSTGDLPRIPPFSALIGLEANSPRFELRGEVDYAGAQRKVGFDELPTDSYTVYNAYMTFRPLGEDSPISVRFAALNFTNEDARLHTSFLKDIAPLPGRNFRISMRGEF